jgi:hypothetical protein
LRTPIRDCLHKTSPPVHIPISEEVHEKLNTPQIKNPRIHIKKAPNLYFEKLKKRSTELIKPKPSHEQNQPSQQHQHTNDHHKKNNILVHTKPFSYKELESLIKIPRKSSHGKVVESF